MDSIGPYQIPDTLPGGRRPLYIAAAQDGSIVAIKMAPLQGLASEERQRFQRETAICATLDHPNVKDAAVCARCGTPLVATAPQEDTAPSRRTPLLIGLVVLVPHRGGGNRDSLAPLSAQTE